MSDSLLTQATAALQRGELEAAERLYQQALRSNADDAVAIHHLGVIACRRGDPAAGRGLIERAIGLRPGDASMHNNLGHALRELGLVDDAAASLEHALTLRPDLPGTARTLTALQGDIQQKNAAIAAHQGGDYASARPIYESLLQRYPHYPEVLNNLGVMHFQLGDLPTAARLIRQAIAVKPALADAHANLGAVLKNLGHIEQAMAAYRKATEFNPRMSEAHYNLGHALVALQRLEEAVDSYGNALALDPVHSGARVGIAHQRRQLCDWRGYEAEQAAVLTLVQAGSRDVSPFDVMIITDDPFIQALAARRMSWRMAEGAPPLPPRCPEARERIRIGYLSSDFRRHPVAWLISDLLERHDRSRFAVYAYSHGVDDQSVERQRIERAVDHFSDIRTLSHQDSAARIREDGIDILVDLNGHTFGCRPGILARRPAPLQVAYLGYPGAMCAPFIDYVLGDAFVTPTGNQPFFDECIVQLPDCFQASEPFDTQPSGRPSRADCGLPPSGFVFCAFNNPCKITPVFFAIWMRLLRAVPGSVLWLVESLPAVARNLRTQAAACGVHPERLVFAQRAALPEYFARLRTADLFLDTLPYNAGTTANDALRAGLPLVTCAGEGFASRMAGSLLHAVGLPELVTHTLADYEALAVSLASDPERLQQIRDRLQKNAPAAPLFDAAGFARNLECAWIRMWEACLRGKQPAAFAVEPSG